MAAVDVADTADLRKARGAFFTPEPIARFISQWALRSPSDTVLEPSAGDASFLVQAVSQLKRLGGEELVPQVHGVEIHGASAEVAEQRVRAAGGAPAVEVQGFAAAILVFVGGGAAALIAGECRKIDYSI